MPDREDRDLSGEPFYNLAFFDAYFSNFIEGTRFRVEDAREIVFEGKIPAQRPKDAHDVIGTYQVLSSRHEMFVSASEWVERPQLFLVSEVHPFDDGNGRLARGMMNAELVSQGERRWRRTAHSARGEEARIRMPPER